VVDLIMKCGGYQLQMIYELSTAVDNEMG